MKEGRKKGIEECELTNRKWPPLRISPYTYIEVIMIQCQMNYEAMMVVIIQY